MKYNTQNTTGKIHKVGEMTQFFQQIEKKRKKKKSNFFLFKIKRHLEKSLHQNM